MAFQVINNADGSTLVKATPGSEAKDITFQFATGVTLTIGRGTVDPDRTFIAFTNSAGVTYYNYVDTTALVTSTTRP